ncbi:hypothetical protein P775_26860 [Puniceibacterium antarcticum]|uniref:Phosphoglycerate mutase n=1 Tax=Puniceibacterium antarcticum TaxID=1206336 RepID=A0A2G8QYG8_9RHOB|nr:histidine phosphatase family protein [Puniceibacterium antarcticum]PIL14329.1 hypothetical protein P775_26860 [Puniceibacterium antarcticum]
MKLPDLAFVMIRHGQTDANRDQRIAGKTEARLTELGLHSARALSDWAWPSDDILLFSSPQQRAQATARLAFPGYTSILLEGLRERDWGLFEGRPVSEIPPRDQTPSTGEPWSDMLDRVCDAITEAQKRSAGKTPVCVAHSGVIRAVRQLTGGSADGPSPANTTPYLFTPRPEGWHELLLDKKDTQWIS